MMLERVWEQRLKDMRNENENEESGENYWVKHKNLKGTLTLPSGLISVPPITVPSQVTHLINSVSTDERAMQKKRTEQNMKCQN
jgi:hypothetical protein